MVSNYSSLELDHVKDLGLSLNISQLITLKVKIRKILLIDRNCTMGPSWPVPSRGSS